MTANTARGKRRETPGGDQFDYAAMSKAVGVEVTPASVEQAQSEVELVNLDEVIAPVVNVGLLERVAESIDLPDGTQGTRYRFVKRVAEITLVANVATQAKALALGRKMRGTALEEQIPEMLKLILEVWRETEPDMTLERLQHGGLDVYRVSKLYQMLFTRPSRP